MPSIRVLNLLTLISAAVAIYFNFIENVDVYRIFKPLTTILVILIPLLQPVKIHKKYSQLIIVALLFCLIGDVFLLSKNHFIFGLASFLIAHVIFTLGFISINGWKSYPLPLIVLLTVGAAYYLFMYNSLNELAIPVLFYFVFIILMCWQGINLYIWRKEFVFKLIAIAVVLFLVSDSIIALDKFKMAFEASGLLVLATYWISISILANSTNEIEKIAQS